MYKLKETSETKLIDKWSEQGLTVQLLSLARLAAGPCVSCVAEKRKKGGRK